MKEKKTRKMKEKKTRKTFVLFALVLTFMLGLVGTSLFAFAESSGAENTVIAADMFDKSLARKTLKAMTRLIRKYKIKDITYIRA